MMERSKEVARQLGFDEKEIEEIEDLIDNLDERCPEFSKFLDTMKPGDVWGGLRWSPTKEKPYRWVRADLEGTC